MADGVTLSEAAARSKLPSLLGAMGFTQLNPHFWLDMMVVGSLAQGLGESSLWFAAGALSASIIWLAVLGAGSRLFAPAFSNPRAWRILDGPIALVMAWLAVRLAYGGT